MPSVAAQSARILVQMPDGRKQWYDVVANDSLIVGSSPSCSVRLESSEIASMHCLIRLENGRLSVQDWYTTLGTFLNGERIAQPCNFGPGDEVRVGDFRLTAQYGEDRPHAAGGAGAGRSEAQESPANVPGVAAARHNAADEAPATPVAAMPPPVSDEEPPPAPQLQRLKRRVTELELENDGLRLQAACEPSVRDGGGDPFDLEMVELLQSEIRQLQHEVAQRDARIAELADAGPQADYDDDSGNSAAFVDRLDALLHELQRSDDRIATLEDLLRAADEAARSEFEERRQLAAWVGDIEARVGEREAEWQAAQDALQKRIDDLQADRDRVNNRLKELGSREATAASAVLIEDLREEVDALRRNLQASEQAREALRSKIDDVEFQNSIAARERHIAQKLREQRLELAQEHAQIARERADVARLKAQVENRTASAGPPLDDADCRVLAFREHLKDLHVEETKIRESKKLTSRLARLWKRLDGN